jgi:hypothetical protein
MAGTSPAMTREKWFNVTGVRSNSASAHLIWSNQKRNATIFMVLTAELYLLPRCLLRSMFRSGGSPIARPPDTERIFESGPGEMFCGVTDEPQRRKLRLIGNNGSSDLGANVAPEGALGRQGRAGQTPKR